jgi:hypothetical protein
MPLRDELKNFADIELVSNHTPVYQEKIYEHTANIEDVVSLLLERDEPSFHIDKPSFHISDIPQDEYQSDIELYEPSSRELARQALEKRQQRIEDQEADELMRGVSEMMLLMSLDQLRRFAAAAVAAVQISRE